MMSNRFANLCLTNLCRRNFSNTALSLQRKKKFTKAQGGFEILEKFCYDKSQIHVTSMVFDLNRFQILSKLIVKLSALEYHVTQEKGTEWAWERLIN